jgi:murein DD-endopeptidase MepM/ murein hydrolase activator NlpD
MKRKIIIFAVVFIGVVVGVYFVKNRHLPSPVTNETIDTLTEVVIPEPELLYGFPVDSFVIEQYKVKWNQNLADVLTKKGGVDYSVVYDIANKTNSLFDVRKFKKGNLYTLFFSDDSLKRLESFVYEIDKTDFLVADLRDSLSVYVGKKDVETVRKTASGVITSSLWNTIKDENISPMLAMELSDIFAWTVDFFGIEKGDYFKAIYDEEFVDSVSINIPRVYAALFHHRGEDYYAFYFEQDSVWDFFDEKGNSLRKAFLKAPLKFSRVSSRFSNHRFHPVLKIYRPHHGVDYAAPEGTPVHALGDGRIIAKGYQRRGGGNYLKIKHNSVYTTVYMHMRGFAKGIAKGVHVKQGQLIGYVGHTGLATGPHLDFRVYKQGRPVDPLRIKAPPVEPVKPEYKERFKEFIKPLKAELDSIPLKR